jgi:hypothetical protein
MTRRATFTKSDLARAVRVADELGKVALWTTAGIAFVESDQVALPSPDQAEASAYDAWKAKREAQRAGRS